MHRFIHFEPVTIKTTVIKMRAIKAIRIHPGVTVSSKVTIPNPLGKTRARMAHKALKILTENLSSPKNRGKAAIRKNPAKSHPKMHLKAAIRTPPERNLAAKRLKHQPRYPKHL